MIRAHYFLEESVGHRKILREQYRMVRLRTFRKISIEQKNVSQISQLFVEQFIQGGAERAVQPDRGLFYGKSERRINISSFVTRYTSRLGASINK